MKAVLGIDWGGTYIKAGVVDTKGVLLKKVVYTSENLQKKNVFIDHIASLVTQLKGYTLEAVGIGAPGIVNVKEGFIYYLPNIPGWKRFPLRKILG